MEKIHHIVKFVNKESNKVSYKIYYNSGNKREYFES